jgi:hypothetical protein
MRKKNRRRNDPKFPLWLAVLGALLVVAAIVLVLGQRSAGGGTPRITVDRDTIDYGDVKLNTELTFEVKVTNQGDGLLRFKEDPYIEVLDGC